MKSPCIKVCKLDPSQTLCVGCFRTVNEIGMWAGMNETRQAQVIALSEVRRTGYRLQLAMKNKKENGK